MMTINTLYELVRNSVEKFASKVAFSMFEGDDVTYAEVGRRIEKVQEILTCAGLHAGDKVALLSSNMPNWCVSYLAVTSAGMVAVPSFWVRRRVRRPSTTHARSEPRNAFPSPIHVDATPNFHPN